jgi:hypothetical protein
MSVIDQQLDSPKASLMDIKTILMPIKKDMLTLEK